MTTPTMFKTPEGQARYFAAYDATLALWPVQVESIDVLTRFGPTHVHTCGPEDAPPLVLLPGGAISSTMWYPNIASLSQGHRVYAPDIIGDMGKSVRTRPISKFQGYAEWLTDVFEALQLDRTHLAGLSLGGAIALQQALHTPDRLGKLVLMAPANLMQLRPLFFLRMAAMFIPSVIYPLSSKRKLLGADSPTLQPAFELMMTKTDFRYKMVLPPVITEAELRQVKTPTLLLLGEHEVIYKTQAAVDRAASLIPQIETAVIPGAGHALNFDQPELVNQRILAFLRTESG